MGKIGSDKWFIYYVYSKDHNPPHFHVKTKDGNLWGKFTIKNFEMIDGNIKFGIPKIKKFLAKNSELIQNKWDELNE